MRSRPQTFSGRKLGALVTDGVDGGFLRQLETEFNEVGATVELVAPAIGGIKSEDGAWIEAKQDARHGAVRAVRRRRARGRTAGEQGDREEPARVRVRRRRVRALQVHRLYRRCAAAARAGAGRRAARRRLQAGRDRDGSRATFAASCAQLRFWAREPVLGL